MRKSELQRMTPMQKVAFIHRMAKRYRYLKPSVQRDIREFLIKNAKLAEQFAQHIPI